MQLQIKARALVFGFAGLLASGLIVGFTSPPPAGQIAFVSQRDGAYNEIYVMRDDGKNVVRLTNTAAHEWEPTWSPDGTKIAFTSLRDGNAEIYVMNANGTNQVRLTNDPGFDFGPSWSPDGTKIVFHSQRMTPGFNDIYVMDANGANQTRLTTNTGVNDMQAVWSPDSTQIAFKSDRDGNYEIYVMDATGDAGGTIAPVRLTFNPAEDMVDDWRGSQIAFTSNRYDGNYEVFVMSDNGDVGGTVAPTRLTTNPADDAEPCWSPDGTKFVFWSRRTGFYDIYSMNTDGSGVKRLTTSSALDADPVWKP